MKYLDRIRKDIDLPSGAKIEIRKLNALNEAMMTDGKKSDVERGALLSIFILENRVGPLRFQGEESTIVNKASAKCAENEIAIEDLEQEDAQTIINRVMEFSGLDKAGQEARKTFPEGQGTNRENPPDGKDVRMPADRTAEAAGGRMAVA